MAARSAILGYPRMGPDRELKKALESYWKGNVTELELCEVGGKIRRDNWGMMKAAGVDFIPSNDFSFYDTTLDLISTLGLVPERYQWLDHSHVPLDTYFAMARGMQRDGTDVTAMEMTKWFDTNYHYIVPEFEKHMHPRLSSTNIFNYYGEAAANGIKTRPVLLGPVSFTLLGKPKYDSFDHIAFVRSLIPVYQQIIDGLQALGCEWIQIDEPCISTDLKAEQRQMFNAAYKDLNSSSTQLKIMVCTYMETPKENTKLLLSLPVAGIHIDLCRVSGKANAVSTDPPAVLGEIVNLLKDDHTKLLSIGVVDGRNIWKNDMKASLDLILPAAAAVGPSRIVVSTSCSLLHCPVDVERETKMDPEIRDWIVFAKQKVTEVVVITKGVSQGAEAIKSELEANQTSLEKRSTSKQVVKQDVRDRVSKIVEMNLNRNSGFDERIALQTSSLNTPPFPTTTIGSFPQTDEIRKARAQFKKGSITKDEYEGIIKKEFQLVIKMQEELGLDVLVHGESERTDMVEYFGANLEGFVFSEYGWVLSYGSRGVKPPILFGDVARAAPITVDWMTYAQSLTEKPMKGMLTGPITILQWSFVRDDQPRESTAAQIALAMRDEVADLEKAGIRIIQIDEAAIREGLPVREADRDAYLKWAVDCFKLTAGVVADKTQIHTHMCYSEFNDIIAAVAAMDADVISIETSRSQMELLDAFVDFKYPNHIGPGVYDIHSPRVPSEKEMLDLLKKAAEVIPVSQIWVNPDCGLKTRKFPEVKAALAHMVSAAEKMRKQTKDMSPESAVPA